MIIFYGFEMLQESNAENYVINIPSIAQAEIAL